MGLPDWDGETPHWDGETPLFDGLGSERTVTNAGQSVTASLAPSAFGQTVLSRGGKMVAYRLGEFP